jgi:uncharacterized circularly permuted ATP-grasp superfamily protein
MMMRLFPELFALNRVAPVEHYPDRLLENLGSVAPAGVSDPVVVALTPGAHNSAYFEHAFLAQQMGVELVEGRDLFVRDGFVYMRTTRGPQRVDVVYRRIDDDKSIYPYIPEMIRFYLGEEPLLNNVPTRILRRKDDLAYTLAHLDELVVKEVHGAGGYGMLIVPTASEAEREDFLLRILAAPEKYIAQPTLALSTCPTFVEQGVAPRHFDLRPFVLSERDITIVPGGLTRVALRAGSLVIKSSQGAAPRTRGCWRPDAQPHR